LSNSFVKYIDAWAVTLFCLAEKNLGDGEECEKLKISKFENERQNTVWVTSFGFLWHHRCVTHFIGKAIISFYKSEPKQILQCLGASHTH
jgi:hypothetical protein